MKKLFSVLVITCMMIITSSCGVQTIKESENLVIPVSQVTEKPRFYAFRIDETDMEVIAVRDSAGNIRTAFNTCQSCYTSGNGRYQADGSELVCQNCGFRFTAEQVGLESDGGCNPWAITEQNRTLSGDALEISYDFLKNSKDIFANW